MLTLKDITPEWIDRIIAAELPESTELEYKRELPQKRSDKHVRTEDQYERLARNVAAMANAAGGVILFGIEEDSKTKAPKVHAITGEPYDNARERLQSQLNALIEPRPDVAFQRIEVAGGYVMALLVPASLAGPHWHGGDNKRFSIRRDGQVSHFTYQELRAAFDRNASARTRARDWIGQRVDGIKAGRTWRPMISGPLSVVHVVPLVSYYQELPLIDPVSARSDVSLLMPRPWQSSTTHDINFDGLIVYPPPAHNSAGEAELGGYSQLFRDGSVEVVCYAKRITEQNTISPKLHHSAIFWNVHDTILAIPRLLNALSRTGPTLVGVSLLDTTGYGLYGVNVLESSQIADRNDLHVPTAYLEDITSVSDLEHTAKSALDMLWQGFSYEASPFYDEEGKLKPGISR